MKKKIYAALVLAAAMGLTACGGSAPAATQAPTTSVVVEATTAEATTKAESTTAAEEGTEATETATEETSKEDTNAADAAGGITKADFEAMEDEQALIDLVADPSNATVDEFMMIANTLQWTEWDPHLGLMNSITTKALGKLLSSKTSEREVYLSAAFDSNIPQVRAFACQKLQNYENFDSEMGKKFLKLLETETDPNILYDATYAMTNCAFQPEVAAFILKMTDSDQPRIRSAAAVACQGNRSKGVDGMVEAMIKLMNDPDEDVKKTACRYAGGLEDDGAIDALEAILNDPAQAKFHGSCLEGLYKMWCDYPGYKSKSERAYRVTMDYLRTTPRSKDVPAWSGISYMKNFNLEKAETFLAEADYYSSNEIYDVMSDILADEDAEMNARKAAIGVIAAHCPDRMGELTSIIDGVSDDKTREKLQKEYDNKNK